MPKMTAKQAAEKWNISLRRVQDYCKSGKIQGAERFGGNWMIPGDAVKPVPPVNEEQVSKPKPQPIIPQTPHTGDNTNLYLWFVLLFVSGGGILTTAIFGKKVKDEDV